MARLQDGCARLGIAPVDTGLLAEEARQLCQDAGQVVLKVIVTRGSGGLEKRLGQISPERQFATRQPIATGSHALLRRLVHLLDAVRLVDFDDSSV